MIARLVIVCLLALAAGCASQPEEHETPYNVHSPVLIDNDTGREIEPPTGGE